MSADVYASGDVPPGFAAFAVVAVLAALGVGLVIALWRALRRDRMAAAAEASVGAAPAALVEGADVVLHGTIRHLADHTVAVRVEITQAGTEQLYKGNWSHRWKEVNRVLTVAPFLLELASGEQVRVHPPRDVQLADELDGTVVLARDRRVRSAELVPGEQVYATGRLERSDVAAPSAAYRDNEWGWALMPSGTRMLLSSEPLGSGLRKRARFHRNNAWLALGVIGVLNLFCLPFYGRALGHTELTPVTRKYSYVTKDSKGHLNTHHKVSLERFGDESVDYDDYATVQEGDILPVRVASGGTWNLGARPTFNIVLWLVHYGAIGFWWIWYGVRRRSTRPWFRRAVNDRGSGRL